MLEGWEGGGTLLKGTLFKYVSPKGQNSKSDKRSIKETMLHLKNKNNNKNYPTTSKNNMMCKLKASVISQKHLSPSLCVNLISGIQTHVPCAHTSPGQTPKETAVCVRSNVAPGDISLNRGVQDKAKLHPCLQQHFKNYFPSIYNPQSILTQHRNRSQ